MNLYFFQNFRIFNVVIIHTYSRKMELRSLNFSGKPLGTVLRSLNFSGKPLGTVLRSLNFSGKPLGTEGGEDEKRGSSGIVLILAFLAVFLVYIVRNTGRLSI